MMCVYIATHTSYMYICIVCSCVLYDGRPKALFRPICRLIRPVHCICRVLVLVLYLIAFYVIERKVQDLQEAHDKKTVALNQREEILAESEYQFKVMQKELGDREQKLAVSYTKLAQNETAIQLSEEKLHHTEVIGVDGCVCAGGM